MKHKVLALAPLLLAVSLATSAETRWSGTFDYQKFQPSAEYFQGRTAAQVDHLCKTGEHAGTEDMEECGHRDFERATRKLNKIIASITAGIKKNDIELARDNQPEALPYFLKAETAWRQYRDNTCYSGAYEIGEASLKYIDFWHCMATMTQDHAKELTRKDE
ncbi:lysozyme inhibitor LprI family protein [Paraburkholderia sp. J67]|uniref:lysozyme inhibitor LprI family protein n=1 Tax=Paraburkholderia sp. J67 TaxID=2805435 RepID=UPI002ABD2CF0|nr:lysozyme inhibitor LprI family protein [Paraburkholderia sp. J67]